MKITGHCIVKNEDRWIWFALQSVLPYLEKVLVYDTGSTDKTVEIIKLIKSDKIIFEEKGPVDRESLVKLRQEQINQTKTDWFLIIDGDEIWPHQQIENLLQTADQSSSETVALINKTRNCLGDIYHYQNERSGDYKIGAFEGNLNIRLIKKTSDMKVSGVYPLEAYSTTDGAISSQPNRLEFCNCWYLHTTYLSRSSLDNSKTSGSLGKVKRPEIGLKLPQSQLPEVFSQPFPKIIGDPFQKRGVGYKLKALTLEPLARLKNLK